MISQTPSIFIAIPAYGGMIHAEFAKCLFDLCAKFQSQRIPGTLEFLSGQSNITIARCQLTNKFLTTPFSHLLFLDCDLTFNSDDILRMLKAHKKVIGLPYSMKNLDWKMLRWAIERGVPAEKLKGMAGGELCLTLLDNRPHHDLDQPLEVKNIGTGGMLIEREVFIKLAEAHPEWKMKDEFVFFQGGIDEEAQQYLSEDYMFCYQWRKAGGKVYCLPSAVTRHIGRFEFTCNMPAARELGMKVLSQDSVFEVKQQHHDANLAVPVGLINAQK